MKKGLFLEMLTEILSTLLSTEGMEVNRNEIFRKDGLTVGEVDIVIRGQVNSQIVQIGIECRNRWDKRNKGRQGRNWIREIIGKRIDLAEFGFTHWFAVSYYGFATTALELAKRENILLLVPGKAEPVAPHEFGPHHWMAWTLTTSRVKPIQLNMNLEYKSKELEAILDSELQSENYGEINISNIYEKPTPLFEVIQQRAEILLEELLKSMASKDFNEIQILQFKNLLGDWNGIPLNISTLEAKVNFYRETIPPNYQTFAFTLPPTYEVIGLIGINEYQSKFTGKTNYLMVALKPGDVKKPIFVFRDEEGNPINISNLSLSWPDYQRGRTKLSDPIEVKFVR